MLEMYLPLHVLVYCVAYHCRLTQWYLSSICKFFEVLLEKQHRKNP